MHGWALPRILGPEGDGPAATHGEAQLRRDLLAQVVGEQLPHVPPEELLLCHPEQGYPRLIGEGAAPLRIDREEALEAADDSCQEPFSRLKGADHLIGVKLVHRLSIAVGHDVRQTNGPLQSGEGRFRV